MAKRSPWTDESKVTEMLARFRDGATILEAIEGLIPESTYFEYIKAHPEMAEKIQLARDYTTEIARAVVSRAIKRGDRDSAKWWLERKNKAEFSTRVEQDVRVKEMPQPLLGGLTTQDGDALPDNISDPQAS